jgi:hypothetical protein
MYDFIHSTDVNFLPELGSLADVIDAFSIVRKESRKYKSDALQYLQNKRSGVVSVQVQRDSVLSMKLCLVAFSVNLSKSDKLDSTKYISVANAHFGLDLSVVLVNQIPVYIGADIFRIVLNSSLNCRTLMSFTSEKFDSSYFRVSYSVHEGKADEISVAVPSLDIWLYLIDWNSITKYLELYTWHNDCPSSLTDGQESTVSPILESQSGLESDDIDNLVVNCENFSVRFHLPMLRREDDEYKHITFAFHGKRIEAHKGEGFVRLIIELKMLKVLLNILQDGKEDVSIPFMQINSIKVAVDSNKKSTELVNWLIEVKVEMMDMGLSYQVFGFVSNIQLDFPEMEVSRSSCSVVLKVHLCKGSILLSDGRVCFIFKYVCHMKWVYCMSLCICNHNVFFLFNSTVELSWTYYGGLSEECNCPS